MKGERCTMMEVPAAITIIGTRASVATGAVARASGVRPKPARIFTLSRTTSSCASRRVVSGATPVSSRSRISSRRPPCVSPFMRSQVRTAASICRPVEAKGPVIGRISPIRQTCAWAIAGRGRAGAAARAAAEPSRRRRDKRAMAFLPGCSRAILSRR